MEVSRLLWIKIKVSMRNSTMTTAFKTSACFGAVPWGSVKHVCEDCFGRPQSSHTRLLSCFIAPVQQVGAALEFSQGPSIAEKMIKVPTRSHSHLILQEAWQILPSDVLLQVNA